jgi:hypothetical protein
VAVKARAAKLPRSSVGDVEQSRRASSKASTTRSFQAADRHDVQHLRTRAAQSLREATSSSSCKSQSKVKATWSMGQQRRSMAASCRSQAVRQGNYNKLTRKGDWRRCRERRASTAADWFRWGAFSLSFANCKHQATNHMRSSF